MPCCSWSARPSNWRCRGAAVGPWSPCARAWGRCAVCRSNCCSCPRTCTARANSSRWWRRWGATTRGICAWFPPRTCSTPPTPPYTTWGPAARTAEPPRRTVRELAARLGKDVELVLAGGDVRIDRRIVDVLKDPLQHLVRNALDHGLESTAERLVAGKSSRGQLSVRVEPRGTRLAVVVEDDGAGLSPENVRATAVRRGLLTELEASKLTDTQATRLGLEPGLSTPEP